MSDIKQELRDFEGSDALGNGDFSVCIRGADRIAELEAALANARRDGMEAAAKWHDEQAAKAQQLSDMKVSAVDEAVWGDYAENHREYAAAIRAALEGEKE